ncbi:MAG: CesT family type III secretion system chaperone [Burkholderiaceae bacterium]
MNAALPESAHPWLREVHSALGLSEAEHRQCLTQAGMLMGDVPILWTCTLTGDASQLMAQAVVGQVGDTAQAAPVLEAVLHTQLLLCGPAMPVFGLDTASRSLMLMQVFSIDHTRAEDAAALLRALQRIAVDSRAVLPGA